MKRPLAMTARLIFLIAPVLAAGGCVTVGPGQVGVLWRASGGTQPELYEEGLHAVNSWNQMYVYDLRSMNHDEVLNVIANNGLSIQLDAAVRYHLLPKEVVAIQTEIGPDYFEKVLEPVLRSEARRVIGQYTPEEIYSTKRDVIERQIREGTAAKIEGRHIALEAVLIKNIVLPDAIRHAIDQKLEAEQDVLRMQYVLQVAQLAADQKKVEAQGISHYNKIIAESLSPAILEFERIEQLGKLANSPNAKTVVMGQGSGAPSVMLSAPASSPR